MEGLKNFAWNQTAKESKLGKISGSNYIYFPNNNTNKWILYIRKEICTKDAKQLAAKFLDVKIFVISEIWKDTKINSQNVYKRKKKE